jgi:NADH:ubiquinone reductase (non-electrogenic)
MFINAECSEVDVAKKTVICKPVFNSTSDAVNESSLQIDYDYLVIAVGAEPNTFNIPGVKEVRAEELSCDVGLIFHFTMFSWFVQNAIFLKEIEDGILLKQRVLQQLERANYLMAIGRPLAEVRSALHWVIVGAGPTGRWKVVPFLRAIFFDECRCGQVLN